MRPGTKEGSAVETPSRYLWPFRWGTALPEPRGIAVGPTHGVRGRVVPASMTVSGNTLGARDTTAGSRIDCVHPPSLRRRHHLIEVFPPPYSHWVTDPLTL